MKKARIFIASALFFGLVLTGCQEDINDLDVQPIDVKATTDLNGDAGSGGGDNPPPGN